MAVVAPSILSADFAHLADDCQRVLDAGAEYLHIDVMDGAFVPNLTIGPCVISSLRRAVGGVFDVHLMIEDPIRYLKDFAQAGADIITFHIEAAPDAAKAIRQIHELGLKASLSVKPGTPVEALSPYLDSLDMVLVMTVEPGFGGQKFMADMVPKIEWLDRQRREKGYAYQIEVDGGVSPDNADLLTRAGTDVLVAGSAVFRAPDLQAAVTALKRSRRA